MIRFPEVRYSDPFDAMIRCYQREWPAGPDIEIGFVARDEPESPVPAAALGCAIEPDDDALPWLVLIVADQVVWQLLDVLAHELAHVVAGPAAEHGPEWSAAFERLRELYLEEYEWSRRAGLTGPRVVSRPVAVGGAVSSSSMRVLNEIQDYYGQHASSPSLRELAEALDMASTNAVAYHLQQLEAAGLILPSDGRSRQCQVTEAGWAERGRRLDPPLLDGLAVQMLWVVRRELASDPGRALAAAGDLHRHLGSLAGARAAAAMHAEAGSS